MIDEVEEKVMPAEVMVNGVKTSAILTAERRPNFTPRTLAEALTKHGAGVLFDEEARVVWLSSAAA